MQAAKTSIGPESPNQKWNCRDWTVDADNGEEGAATEYYSGVSPQGLDKDVRDLPQTCADTNSCSLCDQIVEILRGITPSLLVYTLFPTWAFSRPTTPAHTIILSIHLSYPYHIL